MLRLVSDDWRQGDSDPADSDDDAQETERQEEATALAFAGLSLREAATRTLGC